MNEYIKEVERLIGQLTTAEQQDVVEYYSEYLMDAGIESYQQAVDELGSPRSLARKVLADYSIRLSEQSQQASQAQPSSRAAAQAAKSNVKTVWLIILALLSTPVTIPILLVIGALLFALIAVLGSLLVAAAAMYITVVAVGVMCCVAALFVIWQTPWTGLFYLGIGLFALGASILGWLIVKWLGRKIVWALSWAAKGVYQRFIPRSRAERGRKL
ncbi:DUF1700 domain-containing protein [Levilactobacillus tujiorum]|uniref:DUF1700 domain-containing protein n=1 Tax=Levilactobacillus tujiorum TaxID=2912243 RepID=A0ABX1L4S8_9LACO|nr:DUF1700 domain-containing protein [Levilactobacillus tujiorum]MCH5464335.1 DUF1700 domain-containing protein [Levilactobacillus tujiorum]NLR11354.1 DUF1700 domain-containing protein [Lactobacillus sp. HBUAS51387]NLR29314.1 DUF1700 domain-containing protein [Levilactobacillus tujiorum]